MTPSQPKTRAVLYARVSTEEQREGHTIDSQIAELERFAKEKGWHITHIYKDDGWSGSVLARPDLDCLRDDASKGLFDIVLVNDVDRLARDVSHLGVVKRALERCGVQLVFRKLPTEQSPTHNLMVNILGSFAEFERELITDRTRRGRRHKVEVRKQYFGCKAPYGYRYIPRDSVAGKEGSLRIVPEEATLVKQLFDWVDKEGLSARKVVKRLNTMKLAPRSGSSQWAKSSVLRILRNETYVGVWHYNKHESCEPKRPTKGNKYKRLLKSSTRLRQKTEWLPVILPPNLRIVEKNQWERVQTQLTQNIAFSPRNTKHQYLLKGLVWCGGCGCRLLGDPNHGRFYYRCDGRCKQYSAIREGYLDDAVWGAIEEAVLNPSIITDQLKRLQEQRAVEGKDRQAETRLIEEALIQAQQEEERILEAYRIGVLSPVQLGRELEKIAARKSRLEARKGKLVGQKEEYDLPFIRQSMRQYFQAAAERLKEFNFEQRQRFLRQLVNKILFEGSQVVIRGVIPIGESSQRIGRFDAGNLAYDANDVFAGTGVYSNVPNAVQIVPFELIKPIIKTKRQPGIAA